MPHSHPFPLKPPRRTCNALRLTSLLFLFLLVPSFLATLVAANPASNSTGSCSLTVVSKCNLDGSRCTSCGSCISVACVVHNNSTRPQPPPEDCSKCDNTTQICWEGGGCVDKNWSGVSGLCMQDTRCVVYRNTSSSTVSTDNTTFTLPNFLCDPTSCTAYLPSDTTTVIIPPSTTTLLANDTNSVVATTTSSDTNIMTTTMIALIACCCVIFLGVFIWVSRILSRCFGWQGCLPTSFFARDRDRDRDRDDGTASQTSSSPTGQNAMADVAGRRTYHRNRWRAGDHDVRWDDNASVNTATTEPLPPYVSPDAPPPKYETALIMEITADRRRGEILGHDGAGLGGGGIVGTGNGVVDSIDVLGP